MTTTQENEQGKWYATYIVMRLLFGDLQVLSLAEVSLDAYLYKQDNEDIEAWIGDYDCI